MFFEIKLTFRHTKLRFRKILVCLALIGIIIPFFWLPYTATAAILLDNAHFEVTVTEGGPLGKSQGDTDYFTASVRLKGLEKIAVGDILALGTRSASSTVSGFGIGMVRADSYTRVCSQRTNYSLCTFPFTMPLERKEFSGTEPAIGIIALDTNLRSKLGVARDEKKSVQLMPYIALTDGTYVVPLASGALLASAGRVLEESTTKCDQKNAIDVTVQPTTSSIGDTITIAFDVKPECKGGSEITPEQMSQLKTWVSHGLCTTSVSGVCAYENRIVSAQSLQAGQVKVQTTADRFSPGDKALTVIAYGEFNFKDGKIVFAYFGSAQYKLNPQSTSGNPSLKLSEVESTVTGTFSQEVVKTISYAYNKGSGSVDSKKTKYDCGNGQTGTVSAGQLIVCKYPLKAATFSVTAQALDGSDKVISGAEDKLAITITGKETSESSGRTTLPGGTNDLSGPIFAFINSLLGALAAILNQLIYGLFILTAPFIEALLSIHTYTNDFANVIYPAWEIFRNLGNIFFILAIIAIGLGTIFRVSGWGAKDTLLKLILGALLINFSLVIAQSVLGVADTVQNQFLPPESGAIRLLGRQLMVNGYGLESYVSRLATSDQFGSFGETVTIIVSFILAVVSYIAFLALALFLLIRIIFLWLLLMISPIPYVAMALPVTKGYMTRWWSNFIKFAFMTPAMAFMLNLTALIAHKMWELQKNDQNLFQHTLGAGVNQAGLNDGITNAMYALGSNAIVLVFLFASLKVASSFGAESGGLIEKVSEKGVKAAFAVGGAVPLLRAGRDFGLEKIHEKTGLELRPTKWIEGWKKSRELNQEKRHISGIGKALSKGSSFGNPVVAFQRYWSPTGLKNLVTRGHARGEKMLHEADHLRELAEPDLKEIKRLQKHKEEQIARGASSTDIAKTDEQIQKVKDELKGKGYVENAAKLEEKAHELMNPTDTFSQATIRQAVKHAQGELITKDHHELIDLMKAAIHEDDPMEFMGIMRHLTETYNENEALNGFTYTRDMRFDESAEWQDKDERKKILDRINPDTGKKYKASDILHKKGRGFRTGGHGLVNFTKLYIGEKFGMGDEVANQFAGDISGIAEDKGHKVLMRLMKRVHGKTVIKDLNERVQEFVAENEKEAFANHYARNNRLVGNEEQPAEDYLISGNRSTELWEGELSYFQGNFANGNPEYMLTRNQFEPSHLKAFVANAGAWERAADLIEPGTEVTDLFNKSITADLSKAGAYQYDKDGKVATFGATGDKAGVGQIYWDKQKYYTYTIKRLVAAGNSIRSKEGLEEYVRKRQDFLEEERKAAAAKAAGGTP